MNELLILVGPTAVGKTKLSLQLARRFNGEIVSADSRLFYRGMDIGTAKPSVAEQTAVSHHLIDICNPDETVSLGAYQKEAYVIIDDLMRAGRLPILVGGTGQYVKAVAEGWGIPRVPPQPRLRAALERLGAPELARWLQTLDPIAAAKIHPHNARRLVRALEVTLVAGRPISALQQKTPPPYRIAIVGLMRDRETLYGRIDRRVDLMLEDGLLAEMERLRDAGYGRSLPSMSGLGYRQLWSYLENETTLEEAVERVKFETHRFVRQQAAWFHRDDPAINWFDMQEEGGGTAVMQFVERWLNSSPIPHPLETHGL